MPSIENQKRYQENHSVIMHALLPMFVAIIFGLVLAFVILPAGGYSSLSNYYSAPALSQPQAYAPAVPAPAQTPPAPAAVQPAPVVVTTLQVLPNDLGYVNVRSGPSTNNPVIAKAMPGDKYPYTVANASWYQITLAGGKTGFINKDYVEDVTVTK